MTQSLYVAGVATFVQGAQRAEASLLPARVRGRSSPAIRMAAHVFGQACAEAGTEPSTIPLVQATAFGEIATTCELLSAMHGPEGSDGSLSPLRFAVSVHNAAAGQIAIATGNRGFSTTVSAGRDTPTIGLLEAFALAAQGASTVAVVMVDEAVPPPLSTLGPWQGLAVAFVLRQPAPGVRGPRLSRGGRDRPPSGPPVQIPGPLKQNPCLDGWVLAQAMKQGHIGTVPDHRGGVLATLGDPEHMA